MSARPPATQRPVPGLVPGRLVPGRLAALPGPVVAVARWAAFLLGCWVVLRPALVTTISGDDLINPFFVFDDYGPSPLGMFEDVSRDLHRAGHFNHLGQQFGAIVYVVWAYLIGWGVRYSLVYATAKLVVIVLAVLASARLLRTLADRAGRSWSLWWSRVAVAAVLLPALQIHVAWSGDPVASFPLSGYLSAAIGLAALDVAVRALARDDLRSALLAAAALAAAILYYEINVVMVAALVPVVLLDAGRERRARATSLLRTRALRRFAAIAALPTLVTLILQQLAARANAGYTGTDVTVGAGTARVLVRAVLGSVPAAAWRTTRWWLGGWPEVAPPDVATALVVVAVLAGIVAAARRAGAPPGRQVRVAGLRDVLLVASVPVVVWFGATAVQATTAKVRAETLGVGYVYNFYAFGSIGVALLLLLAVPPLAERLPAAVRRAWPIGFVAVALLATAQVVVNGALQRRFSDDLSVSDAVLDAFAERAPAAQRCEALARWQGMPFFLDDYRMRFTDGLDATYEHFHGEPFCPSEDGAG